MTRNSKLATNMASKIIKRLASKQHMALPRFFIRTISEPNKPVIARNKHVQKNFRSLD